MKEKDYTNTHAKARALTVGHMDLTFLSKQNNIIHTRVSLIVLSFNFGKLVFCIQIESIKQFKLHQNV